MPLYYDKIVFGELYRDTAEMYALFAALLLVAFVVLLKSERRLGRTLYSAIPFVGVFVMLLASYCTVALGLESQHKDRAALAAKIENHLVSSKLMQMPEGEHITPENLYSGVPFVAERDDNTAAECSFSKEPVDPKIFAQPEQENFEIRILKCVKIK